MDMTHATVEERKIIYRARRGLKELDMYFDIYVRGHYLTDTPEHKALFATLIEQEDPDLLEWFMNTSQPDDPKLWDMIQYLKQLHYPTAE